MKRTILVLSVFSLAALSGVAVTPPKEVGKVSYFRAADRADYTAAVASIRDVQHGDLYTMTWQGDCHVDRVLASSCRNGVQMFSVLCRQVFDGLPFPKIATGAGCSAFAAKNPAGDPLVGRNFDYRFPMAHVLLFMPRDASAGRDYASVGTVDAGFAGFGAGSLTNVTDPTKADYPWHAALFPYLCMDGMNEAGFTVSVLAVNPRKDAKGRRRLVTEQFLPGRTNAVPTLAIRYLLDHAGSTEEGVSMMTNFNMFAATGPGLSILSNYHFLLSDSRGVTRVVEWLPPAKEGDSWIPFVTNATEVTNFYLADGYGHGLNRWETLHRKLASCGKVLTETEAMALCRAASMPKGAKNTSWTHWSVVYNLRQRTANIATLGHYDEITAYSVSGLANKPKPWTPPFVAPLSYLKVNYDRESGALAIKTVGHAGAGVDVAALTVCDGATPLPVTGETQSPETLLTRYPLLLGDRLPAKIRARMLAEVKSDKYLTAWGLATEPPTSPKYVADGYWLGPIWAPPTMVFVDALEACGEHAAAVDLAARFRRLVERSGFAENFNAVTGEPLRDLAYSWTAAVYMLLSAR